MAQFDRKDFQQRLQKIEQLVQTIESAADPRVRASAVELMQALMELHGAGIERMLEIVFEAGGGEIIDRLADDELAASLLLLYGLHPLDLETRVLQALDKVRPYLRSHGGNVELIGIADAVVRLRLQGSCNGCASSALTLKLAIEEAIYEAAPDVTGLEVEGVVGDTPRSSLVQLERAPGQNGAANGVNHSHGWEEVSGVTTLASGAVKSMEVAGRSVLFCHVGEAFYAYGDTCPACGQVLTAATLTATALSCSACGQRYDVLRAGRGLDRHGLHLEPFPLLVEQGQAKIALPSLSH
ncbi:MAG: NifU family protein [Acidobacteria bacterium]|nr:NifU family protein [Acidobacteriota bacterium]MBI3423965.1 NifU family protein [Acidobacteriota bacterium]